MEHRDYFFRIPRVISDQKHPFFDEKKFVLIFLSIISNFLTFFHFFLQQPPTHSNHFNFAAIELPPISFKWFLILFIYIEHSKFVVERVVSVKGGQNIQTNAAKYHYLQY